MIFYTNWPQVVRTMHPALIGISGRSLQEATSAPLNGLWSGFAVHARPLRLIP